MRYRELIGRIDRIDEPFYSRLLQVWIDGSPFGDHEVDWIADPKYDPRFSAHFVEKVVFATMVAALDLRGYFVSTRNLHMSASWTGTSRPDFACLENDEIQFFVELTSLEQQDARASRDKAADINARIRRSLEDIQDDVLENTFIELTLPWNQTQFDSDLVAGEAIGLAHEVARARSDFAFSAVPEHFPILHELGARVYASAGGPAHLAVSYGAHTFDPDWYIAAFNRALRSKAALFADSTKLRFFVYVVDFVGKAPRIDLLQRSISSVKAPFESVALGFGQTAQVLVGE